MSRSDPLSSLPRRGTLHLHSIAAPSGWASLALSQPDDSSTRLGIGPTEELRAAAAAMDLQLADAIAPPMGVARLAARRLRAWVVRRGFAPLSIEAWGDPLGSLARAALPSIDRQVHRSWDAHSPQLAAAALAATTDDQGHQRRKTRAQLGIGDGVLAVLAGGTSAGEIDASACFEIVGRAALAGARVALVCPSEAARASDVLRHAHALGIEESLVCVRGAHLPGAIQDACDALLLRRPTKPSCEPWWDAAGGWAMARGLPVLCEGNSLSHWGAIAFETGGKSAASLEVIALSRDTERTSQLASDAISAARTLASQARIGAMTSPFTSVSR